MIIGIGLDLVELSRIARSLERFGDRFLFKILTPHELGQAPAMGSGMRRHIPWTAARFAAKEAALKALGTGMSRGISFRDIEVESLASGRPILHLYGKAKKCAADMGVRFSHISLTHSHNTAAAVVVLEA